MNPLLEYAQNYEGKCKYFYDRWLAKHAANMPDLPLSVEGLDREALHDVLYKVLKSDEEISDLHMIIEDELEELDMVDGKTLPAGGPSRRLFAVLGIYLGIFHNSYFILQTQHKPIRIAIDLVLDEVLKKYELGT